MSQEQEKEEIIEPPYLYERETEILEFTPLAFVDKVIHLINHYAHLGLDALQDFVDKQIGMDGIEGERGMQKAASLLSHAIDKNFDKWEMFVLRRVFVLPAIEQPEADANGPTITVDAIDNVAISMRSLKHRLKFKLKLLQVRNQNLKAVLNKLESFGDSNIIEEKKNVEFTVGKYSKQLQDLSTKILAHDASINKFITAGETFEKDSIAGNEEGFLSAFQEDELYEQLYKRCPQVDLLQ
jgi:hypothetical protein